MFLTESAGACRSSVTASTYMVASNINIEGVCGDVVLVVLVSLIMHNRIFRMSFHL